MSTATHHEKLIEPGEVRRTLQHFLPAGLVAEVRALEATTASDRWPHTAVGYFDDPVKLIKGIAAIKSAKGIYLTLNPVNPALLARAENRIRKSAGGKATSDQEIASRRWLLVDCDVQRPEGISATDDEHRAALDHAATVRDTLRYNYGWPEPIEADSGNGGHLLYRVDLPRDDGGLVQRCLTALAAQFDDDQVIIDKGVFNPARITKLYGTLVCKGDSTPDRPHRLSRILSVPDSLSVVRRELLEALAAEVSEATTDPPHEPKHSTNGQPSFDIDAFITRHGFDMAGPDAYQGGRRWTFRQSPLCEHHDDGPYLIQFASGALSAGCHHNSCGWTWHDLRAKYDPKPSRDNGQHRDGGKPLEKFSFADLRRAYPCLSPPLVDGLIREGETCNVISNSKVGKSWLGYGLALSVVNGLPWLGQFPTALGDVLLVDNELHKSTLANRIPAVAAEMGLAAADYEDHLEVWPMRGRLQSLLGLAPDFEAIERGRFKLIVLDAKYRFITAGASENDNAAESQLYNLIDQFAERTGAAFVLIHHTSKGNQSDKRVTDVGSGAGAQSRAADCHLVLREHEEEGVVVLDAAVRSFAPVEPLALRWNFPLWVPASGVDVANLKGRKTASEERQTGKDKEAIDKIVKALRDGPATARALREKTGLSRERQERLLDWLASEGQLTSKEITIRGNLCREYQLT